MSLVGIVLAAALALGGSTVSTDESYLCWTETRRDADTALPRDILVCRIAGELVEFDVVTGMPKALHPAVARDATGSCWYWRSVYSGWVLVRSLGPTAVLRRDGGGALVYDATVRRCQSEPGDDVTLLELVWRVVRRYPVPDPDVRIDPPLTITGLSTYLATQPPQPITDAIVSPVTGRRISVVLEVASVAVSWGDGDSDVVGPRAFERLVGHPDGALSHIYEAKGRYSVVVSYRRHARWRVEDGPWEVLDVGSGSTVVSLRVDELVARRTG